MKGKQQRSPEEIERLRNHMLAINAERRRKKEEAIKLEREKIVQPPPVIAPKIEHKEGESWYGGHEMDTPDTR